jgi:hypothetical protein
LISTNALFPKVDDSDQQSRGVAMVGDDPAVKQYALMP